MADNSTSEDIILDIQVKYEAAISGIAKYQKQIDSAKASQIDLKKELKDGAVTQDDYNKAMAASKAEIKANQDAIRLLNREIQNNIKIEREKENSMVRLRAEIANNVIQLEKLGDKEDDLAKKKALQEKINTLQDKLNGENEAIQRFYHNVGNYQESVIKAAAGNNTFAQSLLQSSSAGKGLGGVVDMIKGKVSALFAVIIANPVIAIIAAIVIIFTALKKVIDSNEESTAKLNKILAPLKLLLDVLFSILQKLVGIMLDGIIAVGKFYAGLLKLAEALPIVGGLFKEINEQIEASIVLEERKAALEKRTRAIQEQNAMYSRDIAKLRAEAEDKNQHTAEQRLTFVKEANELEKESANNALEIAKEKLSIAEEESSRTKNKTDKERELANLRAEVYKAEETHFNKMRELTGKESAILREITQEQEKAATKAKTHREKELAATTAIHNVKYETIINYQKKIADNEEKSHQDRLNALLKYNAKQVEATIYNREQELKQAGLTAAQIELIKIKSLQRLYDLQEELKDNTLKLLRDEESKQLEIFNTNYQNKLEVVKQGSVEELSIRMSRLQRMQEEEIKAAKKTGADIALIKEKYRFQEIEAQEQHEAYIKAQQQKEFTNRILEAQLNGQNTLAIQLEQKASELATLSQLENESDIDFLNRKLEIQNQLKSLEDDYLDYQINTRIQVMQATATIAGGFQDLFESMAESNATFAVFAKAMALYQIGIDTATALTSGIKQAQSVPFPGNIVAIATTVATVLSNIAKAKKYLTSEKEPKAPKFNTGGMVSGAGSETSDSIRAYLSNGESVLTARATAMFSPVLSAFNQIGGGVPISTQNSSNQMMGEDMLSRAFAKAVATLPNPVVSLQEISITQERVDVLEQSRNT